MSEKKKIITWATATISNTFSVTWNNSKSDDTSNKNSGAHMIQILCYFKFVTVTYFIVYMIITVISLVIIHIHM